MLHRKKSASRIAIVTLAIAALTLTGCAPDENLKGGPEGFVQDLWMFNEIVAINADDQRLDLTEAIVAHFGDIKPDSVIELIEGVSFHEYSALNPSIIDTDVDSKNARTDVVMTAGFIETAEGRNLTILASPKPGTTVPIYFKDVVKFDLTFLDHLIEPGDPLLFDYAFVQAIPTLDAAENGLNSLELLRYRMGKNSIRYFAANTQTSGTKPMASQFSQELGVVLQGSRWAAYPAKSQDMMDGLDSGIRDCAKGTRAPIKCVEKFLDSFGQGAAQSWELIDGQLDFIVNEVEEARKEVKEAKRRPKKPVAPDAPTKCQPPAVKGADDAEESTSEGEEGGTAKTPQCPTDPPPGGEGGKGAGGSISGEPHVRSFDGKRFDMQGVGEYVAASHESLTVQVRTHKVRPSISSLSAIALGFGKHTMMIEAAELHIDGKPVTDDLIELDGARIVNKNHIVTVQLDNGQLVRVVNSWKWALDLEVWNPVRGDWVGLLGNADGDPTNDVVSRDGTIFTGTPTFEEIHQQFSESWRVTQEESLFFYHDGETTETFTDRSMPAKRVSVADLPADHRKQAERMCNAAGIRDAEIFENCVLDYGLLGELDDPSVPGQLGSVRTAVRAQMGEDFIRGVVDSLGQRVPANQETTSPGPNTVRPGASDKPVDHSSWLVTGEELLGDTKARAGITCSAGGEFGPVWGGLDAYAMDSSVCTAAVHAGVISREKGGLAMPNRLQAAGANIDYSTFDGFGAYTSHGVTSMSKPAGPGFNFAEIGE